jgi:hypothetical protein
LEKLGEVLLAIGAISAGALNRALMMQRSTGGRLGTILLEQGIVTEETLARALAKVTGRNAVRWDRVKEASKETIALLPARVATRLFAVPFESEGRLLRVAMRDPGDLAAEDEIAQVTGRRVEPWSITEVRLMEALERFYGERRSARYRVLAERLERGIRPQPAAPAPPPPPDIRGSGKPADTQVTGKPTPPDLPARPTPVPGFPQTSDIWRRMSTGMTDEIEIATWRPADFSPPTSPPAAGIEFLPDEDTALPAPSAQESARLSAGGPPAGVASSSAPAPAAPAPDLPAPPKADSALAAPTAEELDRASPAKAAPARPATFEAARERIRSAENRDEVADAALSYIEPLFPLSALFIARKEDVIGWQIRSPNASRSAFKAIRIRFDAPSIFLNVRLSAAPYQGPLPDLPSHAPVVEAFGRRPDHCAIFPVLLRRRIVAFLFVEHTGAALARERVDELKNLASAIADGLAALIVQQRTRP